MDCNCTNKRIHKTVTVTSVLRAVRRGSLLYLPDALSFTCSHVSQISFQPLMQDNVSVTHHDLKARNMAETSIMISIFLTKIDESTGLLHDKNCLNSVVFRNMASQGEHLPWDQWKRSGAGRDPTEDGVPAVQGFCCVFVLAVDEGKRLCAPKLDLCCTVRLGRSSMNVKVLATVTKVSVAKAK
ncbi:hypothetical protein E5288_WYG012372 [Bos mutus]|uniref:Uncharacterized protein n=1 Tax=Bos mutus TaxID=72004 RepID=A0A6B0RVR2_9CETA|nr:hypothetical protein [Bos mutus]